jgi:hypothetical protein
MEETVGSGKHSRPDSFPCLVNNIYNTRICPDYVAQPYCLLFTGQSEEEAPASRDSSTPKTSPTKKRARSPVSPVVNEVPESEFSDSGISESEGSTKMKDRARKRHCSISDGNLILNLNLNSKQRNRKMARNDLQCCNAPNQINIETLIDQFFVYYVTIETRAICARVLNFKYLILAGAEEELLHEDLNTTIKAASDQESSALGAPKKKKPRSEAYKLRRKVAAKASRKAKRQTTAIARCAARTDTTNGSPQVGAPSGGLPRGQEAAGVSTTAAPPRGKPDQTKPAKPSKPRYKGKCVFVTKKAGAMAEVDRRAVLTALAMGITARPGSSTNTRQENNLDLQGVHLTNSGSVVINTPQERHQRMVADILASMGPEFVISTDVRSSRRYRFGVPGYLVVIGMVRAFSLIMSQNLNLPEGSIRPVSLHAGQGDRPHPTMVVEVTSEGQAYLESMSFVLATLTGSVTVRPADRN